MKKGPFFIFCIGMCEGYVSLCALQQLGWPMGILGFFITVCTVIGMVFNDKSNDHE
jgi:hypothetical protein